MKILEQAERFHAFAVKQDNPVHYLKHMLRYTPDIPTQAAYILALKVLDKNVSVSKGMQPALDYLKRIDLTTFKAASADKCKAMPMPDQSNMLGKDGCRQLKAKRERDGYGTTTSVKGRSKNPNTVSRFDLRVHY